MDERPLLGMATACGEIQLYRLVDTQVRPTLWILLERLDVSTVT